MQRLPLLRYFSWPLLFPPKRMFFYSFCLLLLACWGSLLTVLVPPRTSISFVSPSLLYILTRLHLFPHYRNPFPSFYLLLVVSRSSSAVLALPSTSINRSINSCLPPYARAEATHLHYLNRTFTAAGPP